jgi:phosphoglycolate phosphatase
MIPARYPVVLFDLDGTLTDPLEGVVRCVQYALNKLGIAAPESNDLRDWIGPPLYDSFRALLGDEALALEALTLYRERYAVKGLYENKLYSGMPTLLNELQRCGTRLMVATTKLNTAAERVLEHFDLTRYISALAGSTADGRLHDKAEVIGELLPLLSTAERASCVMVGDRRFDILGARAHNIPCIAVSWGYGARAELMAANPLTIVNSVDELRAALFVPRQARIQE